MTDLDKDDDMKDTDGKDWTDMSILNTKPKLDCGVIDSCTILYHNEATSMGSMCTQTYMANMSGESPQKINEHMVTGFAVATATGTTPMNINNGNAPSTTIKSGGPPLRGPGQPTHQAKVLETIPRGPPANIAGAMEVDET